MFVGGENELKILHGIVSLCRWQDTAGELLSRLMIIEFQCFPLVVRLLRDAKWRTHVQAIMFDSILIKISALLASLNSLCGELFHFISLFLWDSLPSCLRGCSRLCRIFLFSSCSFTRFEMLSRLISLVAGSTMRARSAKKSAYDKLESEKLGERRKVWVQVV